MDSHTTSTRARVPKLVGSDVELGNMILGRESRDGTGAAASRMLLRQVDGFSGSSGHVVPYHGDYRSGGQPMYGYPAAERPDVGAYGWGPPRSSWVYRGLYGGADPQDWGRKYLSSNGGCVYIDLDHLELCTPEVLSARDHLAASRAMLLIAREAMLAANEQLPRGQRLVVLLNNSDGKSNAYGSHLSFLITRGEWHRLFELLYPDLFLLAAFQASSIVVTGAGKVGAENGHDPVAYQISQRADFIETLTGPQTTWRRPLVNTRDEPLCGFHRHGADVDSLDHQVARLHCIFYDNTLCHVSSFLKVGMMQVLLAMLEAGHRDPSLILEDPVTALHTWSHDPDLLARAPLGNGTAVTAVELQRAFLERAKAFVRSGADLEDVPDAALIIELWEDTIAKLEARSFNALRPRLDWILKRSLLERALRDRRDLDWSSPETKHLDLLYSSLDDADGLYWACERSGAVERIVTDGEIERFIHQPPENTRAWTRAMLLRRTGRPGVDHTDWDEIKVVVGRNRWGWPSTRTVTLADPLGSTKADSEPDFSRADSLSDLLDSLDGARDGGSDERARTPSHES
ncbi:MAG: proteasome accessory factor PafA2 family protein [Gemmatimonadales bacterium]|jgi:proteasome accessory factor A